MGGNRRLGGDAGAGRGADRAAGGLLPGGARLERRPVRWTPPRPQAPGHVQVDVKYLPGRRCEFTAVDVYSRYVFARVERRLDSHTAARFLRDLRSLAPFRIHTVQVGGGAEFKDEFDSLAGRLKLHRRKNTPHSPRQNGYVERFHARWLRSATSRCTVSRSGSPPRNSTARLAATSPTTTTAACIQPWVTALPPHRSAPPPQTRILVSPRSVQLTRSLKTTEPGAARMVDWVSPYCIVADGDAAQVHIRDTPPTA